MKTLILVLALIALNANTMFAQTRQQLRDSLSAASEALSFHPDSLNLRLRKASWNVQLEEWQYARDEYDYSKAIELKPLNTDFRLNRANVRILMKRKKEAREDLDEMVKLGVPRANLIEWYRKCK